MFVRFAATVFVSILGLIEGLGAAGCTGFGTNIGVEVGVVLLGFICGGVRGLAVGFVSAGLAWRMGVLGNAGTACCWLPKHPLIASIFLLNSIFVLN